MTKGQLKCILFVQFSDSKRENYIVEPEDLEKSFLDNQVEHKSTITLAEFKNLKGDSDDEEEGEAEQDEEMEDEQDEDQKAEHEAEPNQEDKADEKPHEHQGGSGN